MEAEANPTRAQRAAAGRALAKAREPEGWTQKRLGDRVGAKERTVRSWESGGRPITERRVIQLASILAVDASNLRWSSYASDGTRLAADRNGGDGEEAERRLAVEDPDWKAMAQELMAVMKQREDNEAARAANAKLRIEKVEHLDAMARADLAAAIRARSGAGNRSEDAATAEPLTPRAINGAGGGSGEQPATTEGAAASPPGA